MQNQAPFDALQSVVLAPARSAVYMHKITL